jgi:precorrin-6B methylase 2/glycosyltransferase involved in cell wall biosynthesis
MSVTSRSRTRRARGGCRTWKGSHASRQSPPRSRNSAAHTSILDYGCAEGVIILGLAKRFPDKQFTGIDHAATNIVLCQQYARELGLDNVHFFHGSHEEGMPAEIDFTFDAVICSEVLEHVEKPWELMTFLEQYVNEGGRAITTVPAGAWEASGLYNKKQWPWRAHIWHINKWMLRQMFADKEKCNMVNLPCGITPEGRAMGHIVFTYEVDGRPVHPVDPVEKAFLHRSRQSVGAAIIAHNSAETILKMLNSIHDKVQQVSIALGPCTDQTRDLIDRWTEDHPWVDVIVNDVPKIEPYVFGFDDARNASVAPLQTDWVLWIDTDEYMSGDFRKYVRQNCCDSYALHQHHFTCDPRGAPTQLDKPARLFRTDRGFKFYGKVHEHAEKGVNGGPGFIFMLPDVDLGHTGYVNEDVRRARFGRNFPLLEWDRKAHPNRRLGHYLWLRDIIHRMRYFHEQGIYQEARRLADEGVDFYRAKWEDFDAFGMGGINSLAYYGEALAYLGRGVPITIQMTVDGNPAGFQGVFEDAAEAARIIERSLKPEFDKRKSGYWK